MATSRSRSRAPSGPMPRIGHVHLSATGVILAADAGFCALALDGAKPRAKANALKLLALASWKLGALLAEAKASGAPVMQEVRPRKRNAPALGLRLCPLPGKASAGYLLQVETLDGESPLSKLEQERDNALRSAQQKGEFLANMSHELRTPLNAILGFLRLLEEGETLADEVRKDYLQSARNAGMGLLELVNNILDLAKIEADRLTLETVEFDPLRLIEEVCKTLAPQAHGKGIEIACHVAPGVPALLQGDPTRLRQVLLNLAGNAVKFTEHGAVTLTATRDADPAPNTVRFAVRDTGVGIPAAVQKSLFQSFVQRDDSITRRFGGTGLGLSICRQLVEQMGGTITVESTEGAGSTFCFAVSFDAPSSTPSAAALALRGVQVVVLDPNALTGELLASTLAALGAEVTQAKTAWEAQNLLVQHLEEARPVQLVLVDHALQRDAALSFAHSVRTAQLAYRPDMVYLAGIGQLTEPDALRSGGYAALLTKPVPRTVLGEILHDVLRSQTSQGSAYAAPVRKTVGELTNLAARHHVRVLVAEDNAVNQKLIHALLTKRGYQVTLVPNGKAAVQAVSNDPYDIVLMDVQMPVMDGLSATREIRRRIEGRLPIVAMTADAMDGDRERCLAAGMDDYLSKPILPDQLSSILEHWLGRSSADAGEPNLVRNFTDWGSLDHSHLDTVRAYAKAHRPSAFTEFLSTFEQDLARALQGLNAASETGDWAAVAAGAHQVALIAEGFGAPRLHVIALELETHGREQRSLLARDLVAQLHMEWRSVQVQLHRSYGDEAPPLPGT